MRRIDVIAPVLDEEACLERFHAEVRAVLATLPYECRIILVDDGSTDRTPEICRALAQRDPALQYVRLSRNFGHQAALTAGLDVADADAVITMDSDLQHPPEAIPGFVREWESGAELVAGVRSAPDDLGLAKRLLSRAFYRLLNRVSDVPIVPDAPDFRLLDAKVVAAIRSMREQSRFLRGMYSWIGFRQASVPYRQAARAGGASKYGARKMGRLALAAMLSFSRAPLRLATWVGLAVSVLSFGYGLYAIAQAVVFRQALPGWASIAVLVSFLSGVQLLTLGLFGEYLGQVLEESKGRPLYVVAESTVGERGRAARPAEGAALRAMGAP
jgi:dolichol-phosphate mannosyltransferase